MQIHALLLLAALASPDGSGHVVLSTQSEVWESTVAVSPSNPRAAVAVGMQQSPDPPFSFTGQPFRSTDGGATWQYGGKLGLVAPLDPSSVWARHGDPVITVDRQGVFYISTLLGYPAVYPLQKSGIGVFRSTDDGATWEGPFIVTQASMSGNEPFLQNDKEWILTDNSGGPHDGNVYVAWLRAVPGDQQTIESMFARSTDGGRTWREPHSFGRGGSGQMLVDADGVLHVLWARQGDMVSSVSRDGGATFEPAVVAVSRFAGSFPSLAADLSSGAHRGNLYMVWASGTRPVGTQPPLSRSVAGAVMFVRSTDGGRTWSQPSAITAPQLGNVAAFPSVACDPATGEVIVAWLDRRDQPGSREFRLYATRSTDGGATFAAARAFTGKVSLDTAGFIGDYYNTAAHNGVVLSIFSDATGRTAVAPLAFDPPRVRRRAVRR